MIRLARTRIGRGFRFGALQAFLAVSTIAAGAPLLSAAPVRADDPPGARSREGQSAGLDFRETTLTAGPIEGGSIASFRFVVHNSGSAARHLISVHTTCGCTVAHFDRVIAPGHDAHIDVAVQTEISWRSFEKELSVVTDDPGRPAAILTVRGQVIPLVEISPEEGVLKSYDGYTPVRQSFTIHFHSKSPMFLRWPPALSGPVKASLSPANNDSSSFQVTLVVSPPANHGDIMGVALIQTNNPAVPPIRLSVFAANEQAVSIYPPMVTFLLGDKREVITRSVTLISRGNAFRVISSSSDNPHVKCRVDDRSSAITTYVVGLEYDGEKVLGNKGIVTIHTDSPTNPVLEIPYSVLATDGTSLPATRP